MPPLTEAFQQIIADLPDSPGVYQFLDDEGNIIYVGKAKSLKRRVSSYFNRTHESAKVAVMVNRVADLHPIVVDNESDALLLENNLIKKYQPRYNINLKDDKSYPWIVIRNEVFPRVYLMRNPVYDGSQYFGPYSSVGAVRTQLDMVRRIYALRTCTLSLTTENIAQKKFKRCLEYHIGNCHGPCEGLQTEEDYVESIAQIRNILKGNVSAVIQRLKALMGEHAAAYRFEEAEQTKQKIVLLEHFRSKTVIVNSAINHVDVFSYEDDILSACVNYLRIVGGAIVQTFTLELNRKLDEQPAELLGYAITELRSRFMSQSREIIVPFEPDVLLPGITYTVPVRGDRKTLLELSRRNAVFFRTEKKKQIERADPEHHSNRIMETLKKDLHLTELPVHIECFDNSNIHGTNPVSACVVFKDARPSKKDYRRFRIKTVEGPDDYASMEEVVTRRYRRLIDEDASLPQLIIIDGGKGQLSSALHSLEQLDLKGRIAIISIAEKLEEIYFPGDTTPLYLDKRSESLKLIQRMRDEAHRFGITFHRNRRSKAMMTTELLNIEGIGHKTVEKLLLNFKSVARIRKTPPEELEKVIGKHLTEKLIAHFGLSQK